MCEILITRIKLKTPLPYELTAIHHDTHDTKTFFFALPDDATLVLLPGDHLYVHAMFDAKPVRGMRLARCRGISMTGRSVRRC